MHLALNKGFVNATELADYLVTKGLAFRDAHHAAGSAVQYAESRGESLESLSLQELQQFSPLIGDDVYAVLDYGNAVARRQTYGSTGPESVARQLAALDEWIGGIRPSQNFLP